MKHLFSISLFSILVLTAFISCAQQDKSKRPSPPVTVTQKVGETTITIDYSQPSVKGRTIGVDLEPKDGTVWRAGANEATVFETDKDILVEGKVLPKGKYGFFILVSDKAWTVIFNKTWNQWGSSKYKEADDVLRVGISGNETDSFSEKLTYKISPAGNVSILWGTRDIKFAVQEKK